MGNEPETECFLDTEDIQVSCKTMLRMAKSQKKLRIGIDREEDDKKICVFGCYNKKCEQLSGKCKLSSNNIAALAKSSRKYLCAVAIQFEADNPNVTFGIDKFVRYVDPIRGVGICDTLVTNNSVNNQAIIVRVLRDETYAQENLKKLGDDWELKGNSDASFFQLMD